VVPGNDVRRNINKGTIFLVREIGRVNRVAVLSRDKTDVSRGGEVNDTVEGRGWVTDVLKE